MRSNNLKNKGKNIWVYEPNDIIFAGVEFEEDAVAAAGLEQKTIQLVKYAYYRHIGSYTLIKQVGINMRDELKEQGVETCLPYIEIYGHWTNDETRLETELFMSLM